ncbi:dienelactone hydrolase family protein [Aeromicrobium sp. CF3.5]|uniref:dienelactone hydrolase family protein n=1 Tax=Aeromicrobium sp. CF3.5 TaxID=3373078 RepID=UPI003EE66009
MLTQTLSIPMDDGPCEAYVSRPDDQPHPGVLMFPDAIGLRPQIKQMADRIASWGYVVLVPHMFYRSGSAVELAPPGDLKAPGAREAFFDVVVPFMQAHTTARARADLPHYVAALIAQPGVTAPLAVSGYCMGGRLALQAASWAPGTFAAAAFFHAAGLVTDESDSPHLAVDAVRAEVLGGHADQDASNPAEAVAALDAALDTAGVTRTTAIYPEAPHGFSMADTSMYQEAGAERHFDELEQLLARTVGA